MWLVKEITCTACVANLPIDQENKENDNAK